MNITRREFLSSIPKAIVAFFAFFFLGRQAKSPRYSELDYLRWKRFYTTGHHRMSFDAYMKRRYDQ